MCRSVPQIVVFVMRTIASVGFAIVGSGLSSSAFWPGPWNTNAFMTTSIAMYPGRFLVTQALIQTRKSAAMSSSVRHLQFGGAANIEKHEIVPLVLPAIGDRILEQRVRAPRAKQCPRRLSHRPPTFVLNGNLAEDTARGYLPPPFPCPCGSGA